MVWLIEAPEGVWVIRGLTVFNVSSSIHPVSAQILLFLRCDIGNIFVISNANVQPLQGYKVKRKCRSKNEFASDMLAVDSIYLEN